MAIYKSRFTGEQVDRAVGYALDLSGVNINAILPKLWLPFQKYANVDAFRTYAPTDYDGLCASELDGDRYVNVFYGTYNDWWNTRGKINTAGRFLFTSRECSFVFNIKPETAYLNTERTLFECSENFNAEFGGIKNRVTLTISHRSDNKTYITANLTIDGQSYGDTIADFDTLIFNDNKYHKIVITQGVVNNEIITRFFIDNRLLGERRDVHLIFDAIGYVSNVSVFTTNGAPGYDFVGYTKDFIFYNADISYLIT